MMVSIPPTIHTGGALSFSLVPFLFLAVPLTEIAVFVLVGSKIGVLPTVGLVILTAAMGSILLRWQGFNALARIQRELAAHRVPGKEMVQGVMILLAGFLLLTPGFVTDALGILLFIPPVRDAVWRFLSSRVNVQTFGAGFTQRGARRPEPGVVDLDEDEYQSEANPDSPWSIENDAGRRNR
jgi:UPF0716 protein FxsA